MTVLPRFIALYALMYGAFGVSSPFLPAFFAERGLTAGELGLLFGAGTAIRLVSGPLYGRLADLTGALRGVLASCALVAAAVALGLLVGGGFPVLLAISLAQAAALAPITTLADALTVRAIAEPRAGPPFEYGWVRGTGSGVFILGTLLSGQVVAAWGLASILWLHAAQLALAAGTVLLVPAPAPPLSGEGHAAPSRAHDLRMLMRIPEFRRVLLVSTLVLGSHAMHDTFAVIRWTGAGIMPPTISVLWSESVAAEVVVFFLIGPALVARLGTRGVMALAAAGGLLRWAAMASTTAVTALAVVQPLHGLTFAALHLACMRVLAATVPPGLAATAQATYAVGAAAATAVLTLVSGGLYARLGPHAFLVMALFCAIAIPLALRGRVGAPRRELA